MAGQRYRPWTVVFYGTKRELFQILHTYECRIAHYAFITHDRDTYLEDVFESDKTTIKHAKGDLEKEHIHLIVDFFNGHTFTAVKKLFTTETDNPRVEVVGDRVAQFRYLTHKDDPEKYQYPDSDVISNDISYYENLCKHGDKKDTDNIAEQIVNDMLKGVAPRIMVSRYGRDFVIHYRQYQEMADSIRSWDFDSKVRMEARKAELEPVQLEDQDENVF